MNFVIKDDLTALESIKPGSRTSYMKIFQEFRNFVTASEELDSRIPTEEEVFSFMKYLREEKGAASSSMWTKYSMLNAVMKSKYNFSLKTFLRVTILLKSFDTDIKKKAAVFSRDEVNTFLISPEVMTPYWLVRKVIVIISVFGGLRHTELMVLSLEKIVSSKEGVTVTHDRAKQRSDKRESKFLIPRGGGGGLDFASVVERYLTLVREELGKTVGRVLWTGRQDILVNTPMGKNMVSKVPYEIAKFLKKANPQHFTFHSFRRTSATLAADSGSSPQQMQDFFGWKSPNMTTEYITTSKAAINKMATFLNPSTAETPEETVAGKKVKEDFCEMVEKNDDTSSKSILFGGDFATATPSISNNQNVVIVYGDFYGTIA